MKCDKCTDGEGIGERTMKKHYPAEITSDVLRQHEHISDNEIRVDIADTETELRNLDPLYSVRNRLGFIQYLRRVLDARRETHTEDE